MKTVQQDVDERTNLTGSNKFELLLFRLGGDAQGQRNELFGINVFKIREIVAMPTVTAIAGATPHMLGVVNLRGQIIPVIDLPAIVGCHPKTGLNIMLVTEYARTTQAFAELSHEFHLGAISLLPYASLAAVSHATDRMIETGGAAALSGGGGIVDASFTTLGVRAEQKAVVGDDMLLTLAGTLGWRHAFAEPVAGTYRLADGSDFDVVGAPIAGDVLVLNAGINLDVSVTTQLGLTYAGQLGGNAQSHALKAIWAGRF